MAGPRVKRGEIYLPNSGGFFGHIVLDATDRDNIVVQPFTRKGKNSETQTIDAFKLAVVRYSRADILPDWIPADIMEIRCNI